MKNQESFQDALICQYRDLIHEAILECETEHKTRLNIGKLNAQLKLICKAAQYDGLPESVLNELINESFSHTSAKAA